MDGGCGCSCGVDEGREARRQPGCREVVVLVEAAPAGSEKGKRGTDDDVRRRMRHTAARLVWRPVVDTLDFASLLFLLCMGLACGS